MNFNHHKKSMKGTLTLLLHKMCKEHGVYDESDRIEKLWRNCDGCKHKKLKEDDFFTSLVAGHVNHETQDYKSFQCRRCIWNYDQVVKMQDKIKKENERCIQNALDTNHEIIECKAMITEITKKIKELRNETSKH